MRITIDYIYDGFVYVIEQAIDTHKRIGPDVICFNADVLQEIQKKWKPGASLTVQSADGSLWDTAKNRLARPRRIGPAPPLGDERVEHTPICWHEPGCTFWCTDP